MARPSPATAACDTMANCSKRGPISARCGGSPCSSSQLAQARGRVDCCSSGAFSMSAGSASPKRATRAGEATGTISSPISRCSLAPGQTGSPKWTAASSGSRLKSKGTSLVAKLMVMPGWASVKRGSRGISQRVPKVGRMARLSTPPAPRKAMAETVAAASRDSPSRTSAA